ncbi:MAG: alanine racemase [Clostridia bacterium]|nr:alanine racemase [Clostridia bacterium]
MNLIVIEEEKIQHNINIIKEKVKNITDDNGVSPKIIAVLKGNAYGMGIINVAKKLLDNNIDFFAVTEIAEAIELRNSGFNNEILVLNSTCIKEEVEQIVDKNLIATVGSIEALNMLNEVAKNKQKVINYHLKIDTGFCRFGFDANKIVNSKVMNERLVEECECENNLLEKLTNSIKSSNNIKLTGTYSHFQESYANDDKMTRKQFNIFLDVISKLKSANINPGMLHICNSSAFFKYKEMYMNAVRIGSALTGRLQISNTTGLQRVGYLESEICDIKYVKKGQKIGYSGTYEIKKDTKTAVVEAGYFDGVGVTGPKDSVRLIDKIRAIKRDLIALSKDGTRYVEINEKRYPILGRIGMKNFMIDISNENVQIGEKIKIDINLVLANQNIKRELR